MVKNKCGWCIYGELKSRWWKTNVGGAYMVDYNLGGEKQMWVVHTWCINNWMVKNKCSWCIHGGLKTSLWKTSVGGSYIVSQKKYGENNYGCNVHGVLKADWCILHGGLQNA